MVVAGVVIETLPERAASVARRLSGQHGLKIHGMSAGRRIAATWSGASGDELEQTSEQIVAEDREILGIFPTFVGQDEE